MNSIKRMNHEYFPKLLKETQNGPDFLYVEGEFPSDDFTFLTIVGSRKHTSYGKDACETLIAGLKGLPIVIVSGLALGIDSIAHRAAMRYGLKTIAVPGSGLSRDVLYPFSHHGLAEKILESNGALVSPFEPDARAAQWTFPARNMVMAGLSHATLVIEAELKSGTLITSKYATELNRNVFAVPGSIFSRQSDGPHMLIRLGATPITKPEELAEALGFSVESRNKTLNFGEFSTEEIKIIKALSEPLSRDALLDSLNMDASAGNAVLSLLEIKGVIIEREGFFRLN